MGALYGFWVERRLRTSRPQCQKLNSPPVLPARRANRAPLVRKVNRAPPVSRVMQDLVGLKVNLVRQRNRSAFGNNDCRPARQMPGGIHSLPPRLCRQIVEPPQSRRTGAASSDAIPKNAGYSRAEINLPSLWLNFG